MSTLTNHGALYFELFTQNFNGDVMLDFLRRLIRQIPQKVFLIVDKHPVYLSAKVNRWLEQHAERIRMFLLPSYSRNSTPLSCSIMMLRRMLWGENGDELKVR
ncbi:transposase [Leptolyngbya sp. NM3-A1]